MKRNKLFVFFLMLVIVFSPLCCYAKTLTLNKMMNQLVKSSLTSLQRMELVEKYKGQIVKGSGRVKDILKSFGSENEAMVYLQKPFRGKQYEVVLTVSIENAEKVKKGKTIRFEGSFEGMTFETLRFKDAKIIKARGLCLWPFA